MTLSYESMQCGANRTMLGEKDEKFLRHSGSDAGRHITRPNFHVPLALVSSNIQTFILTTICSLTFFNSSKTTLL